MTNSCQDGDQGFPTLNRPTIHDCVDRLSITDRVRIYNVPVMWPIQFTGLSLGDNFNDFYILIMNGKFKDKETSVVHVTGQVYLFYDETKTAYFTIVIL